MDQRVSPFRFVPAGFTTERTDMACDPMIVGVRAITGSALRPVCGTRSRRVQSQYRRQAADLPMAGRRVILGASVRRFWCDAALCGRRVFAERFGNEVLAPHARRTERLETIVHHLGLALGGRPAANFAGRLMAPVRNDTLLRVVRRRARMPDDVLTVVGIADFPQMIRTRAIAGVVPWLERAADSLVASFSAGVRKDEAAVGAAIVSPWSNGQTEGHVTRLKLVKRQMYGRGKIDLLQARLVGAK